MTCQSIHRTSGMRRLLLLFVALPFIMTGCATLCPDVLRGPSAPTFVEPTAETEVGKPINRVERILPQTNEEDPLPISLQAIFQLVEGQNPQIGAAYERLVSASLEEQAARQNWLPQVYVGAAYYRHEGGVQLQEGPLVESSTGALFGGAEMDFRLDSRQHTQERMQASLKALRQRAEVSRLTVATLIEAASAYTDLVAAQTGLALAQRYEKDIQGLLERARKRMEAEPGAEVEVAELQAAVSRQAKDSRRLRQQRKLAAAKIAHDLGFGDNTPRLKPSDKELLPLHMLETDASTDELTAQALANAAGIRELEEMLALVCQAQEAAKMGRCLPMIEARMREGYFGAGPHDELDSSNQWDLCVQAKWNLTDLCRAPTTALIAEAGQRELHLTYDHVRNQTRLAVQEAIETIRNGADQLRLGEEHIRQTERVYRLARQRLENNVPGSSHHETLLALQAEAAARFQHLDAIREYNKAQLRLSVLLGGK